jgi:cobalt-zinc-cadmium efflux system outer membrane protein
VLALLAAPARSESAPLTLRQAIQAALAANPDLAGFAYELRAQDARTDAAGLRPAPTLSADIENIRVSGLSGCYAKLKGGRQAKLTTD